MARAALLPVALYLWLAALAAPSLGQQTVIGNRADLIQAIRAARGGERIVLAPGEYGTILLRAEPKAATPLTITSADPTRPATFTGADVVGARGLTLANLRFEYRFKSGDRVNFRPFSFRNVEALRIQDSEFRGDVASNTNSAADGFGTGIGLAVTDSRDVWIERSRFTRWHRGAVFSSVSGLNVLENHVTRLRSDGMNFVAVNNVVIARNHIHDFETVLSTGDHPDMIQFWTTGTNKPTTNVVIRDNILDSGAGPWTQTIFMRNEEVDNRRAGQEMFYRNIEISNNLIRNAHLHGITVGETIGLRIANNTILQAVAPNHANDVTVPRINLRPESLDVRVENNIAPLQPAMQPGWISVNNLRVQRVFPHAKDFYGNFFVDALAPGNVPLSKLRLLPDAPVGPSGASIARFDAKPAAPTLLVNSRPLSPGRGAEHQLEAAGAFGPNGPISLDGAILSWSVNGAAIGQGRTLKHRFPQAGLHSVSVVATLPGGSQIRGERTVLSQ